MIFDEFARISQRVLLGYKGSGSVRITAIRPSRHGPLVVWEAPDLAADRERLPVEGGGEHLGPPAGPLLLRLLARTLRLRWRDGSPRCPADWDRLLVKRHRRTFGDRSLLIGPGWSWLLEAGAQTIRALGTSPTIITTDVKEKYGKLSWNMCTIEEVDSAEEIADAVEELSAFICEECGAPERLRSGGWTKCRCDKHSGRTG